MSSIKEYYDNTFKIYQTPVFEHNVLTIEHKDTSKWTKPVRIFETNGSASASPTLHNFLLTSPNVDPSTRYRYFSQKCNSVYRISSLTKTQTSKTMGFDQTLDEVLSYIHNPLQTDELLLVNHKTDIEFNPEQTSKHLFKQLSKNLRTVNYQTTERIPQSVIVWVSTTSTTQIPIAETFTYNTSHKPVNLYFIITSEHNMPPSVSSILPFTQETETSYKRQENMISMQFTFEKHNQSSLTSPEFTHYNYELEPDFTLTNTTSTTSNLQRKTYKFTPKFGKSFIMAIPLTEHKLISLTVTNTSFLSRTTIYHLDASTITQIRSPVTLPSTNLEESDIFAMKCYYDTYLSIKQAKQSKQTNKSAHINHQQTLSELKYKLQENNILSKHPDVETTLNNMISEQTSKTSALDIHYNKLTELFEVLTDTNDTNKIYNLLNRKVKSFIVKINLLSSLPPKCPTIPSQLTRNYSMVTPPSLRNIIQFP